MRRRSIVGPLLLIAIGVVFLLNNLNFRLDFFGLLSQYWPVILVIWGLLRAMEILFWYFRGQALPLRGFGGGEWVAIVFLCLFGSALFIAHGRGFWFPMHLRGIEIFGEPFDYEIPRQVAQAVGKSPRIVIENSRGNTRVSGSDATEVSVIGHKNIRSMRQEDANQADRQTPVEITRNGDVITIRSIQDRVSDRMRVSSDLEVTVPKGAIIEGRGRYGDFDVTDLEGGVEIHSDNAGIRVQNVNSVKAELRRSDIIRAVNVKGAVDLRVTGQSDNLELENIAGPVTINGTYFEVQLRKVNSSVRFDGYQTDFRMEKCPGQFRMTPTNLEASDLVGPFTLSTSRPKDVQLIDVTEAVDVRLDHGDVELRSSKTKLPKANLRTRAGAVTLTVPDGSAFSLRANTNRGDVVNDYGNVISVDSGNRRGSMSSTNSGPEIVLETDRGDVVVRKATGDLLTRPELPDLPDAPEPDKGRDRDRRHNAPLPPVHPPSPVRMSEPVKTI